MISDGDESQDRDSKSDLERDCEEDIKFKLGDFNLTFGCNKNCFKLIIKLLSYKHENVLQVSKRNVPHRNI